MKKSSKIFVGMDVHKESIDIAIADGKEARAYGLLDEVIVSRDEAPKVAATARAA